MACAMVAVTAGIALWTSGRSAEAASTPAVPGSSVDIVKVGGMIDPAESNYVLGSIRSSEQVGATVVLQLDSLGGYGSRAKTLAAEIRKATVPVVAWVGPLGAKAQGQALFLVYSSALAAMAPGAGLGAGVPFDPAERASKEPPAVVEANKRALEALAPGAGATAAGARLAAGHALPAGPALRHGAIAVVQPDIGSLLRAIDGRTVVTAGGRQTLHTLSTPTNPVEVRFHEIGPFRRLLHAVGTPVAVYVLLVLGLWGVLFELTQPGVGLAGIGGALSLALAGYGLWVIAFRWVGLVMIIVGTGLQALDVVIKRLAWFTALGTAMFFTGSLVTWWGVAPAIRVPLWLVIMFTVGGFILFGFGFTVAVQARERIRSQQVGLVGLTGEVRSDLNPEGGVIVKGTVWRARTMNGPIVKGTKVRVRRIDGLVLQVEPEPGTEHVPDPEAGGAT
jgi:membrane-bound serine protease (ClpP class)